MFDVVGIGLNAIVCLCRVPRYPGPGEKVRMTGFSRQGGGQVATALVALSRWGLRAMYVGTGGDDEHGRLSLFLLREEGIDLSRARTVPGAVSQFAVILVQGDSGERTILWERDARLRIRPEDIPREEIRRSRAVFIDGHDVPASLESARVARGAGGPVALDAEKVQEGRGGRGGGAGHAGGGECLPRGVPFPPPGGQAVSGDFLLQQRCRGTFLPEVGGPSGHPLPGRNS